METLLDCYKNQTVFSVLEPLPLCATDHQDQTCNEYPRGPDNILRLISEIDLFPGGPAASRAVIG